MSETPTPTTGTSRDPIGAGLVGLAAGLAAAGVVLAVFGLLLRILTHHPFFDEGLHAHFLWLLSSGLEPHEDFWCQYPVFGYVLSLPLMRALPDTAYALLALRAFTGAIVVLTGVVLARHGRAVGAHWLWGVVVLGVVASTAPFGRFLAEYSVDHFALLPAVGALALAFGPARPGRVGTAAALATLSLLLTPKWMLPLAGGLTGFVLLGCLGTGRARATLISAGAGALAAVLIAAILYGLAGISLIDNISNAHVFMTRYKLGTERDLTGASQAATVGGFLIANPLAGALVVLGLVGWGLSRRRLGWPSFLPGAGVLVAVAISLLRLDPHLEQYILPTLVSLGLFAPFAGTILTNLRASAALTLVLTAAFVFTVGSALGPVADGFRETPLNARNPEVYGVDITPAPPAVAALAQTQRLLEIIPEDETIVAAWPIHPMFRRDLTFVTTDERPSFRTHLEGAAAARFDPATLRRALRERPPALISLINLQTMAPPEWLDVCIEFLRENRSAYTDWGGGGRIFVRSDLLRRR